MKTLRNVSFLTLLLACTGCPNGVGPDVKAAAAKTASDAAAGVACVAQHWGESVFAVALACFNQEEQLASDAIADAEVLLQKNGAKPTVAYLTDSRVQQRVLAKKAAAGVK